MVTPVIQFTWTVDQVKTMYTVLGVFKILATQAEPALKAHSRPIVTSTNRMIIQLLVSESIYGPRGARASHDHW